MDLATDHDTRCAVCPEIYYSNKINMLHQDNCRVQKPRGVRRFGNGHQLSCRIEQPDRLAFRTSSRADGFDKTARRVRGAQVPAESHVCDAGVGEGN